jgi:hypothetical protein
MSVTDMHEKNSISCELLFVLHREYPLLKCNQAGLRKYDIKERYI